MSRAMDKTRKRQMCPLDLGGEIIHLRGLTHGEVTLIEPFIGKMVSNGIAIGFCMREEDGTPSFTTRKEETIQEFGERVLEELDAELSVILLIADKIQKITEGPPQFEALVKN